ncbi:DNA polymerase I [Neopusillimonas maritima]|uniref:DNA polymerase I n=1 Tax=Neopusillimonas maritima TaxID=2026239 RepID=A0A3A1YSK7_9BURK|nr:DNA polymerase I [Neopusillimonas maritima]RIY40239.1 DNA polymerase I [Neopusillimonas maritima]
MKKTLLLVDGSSYLYRAFHALPDLRNAKGQPTGALYGVISMLRRLSQDYKADYAACIFDAKGSTFRDEIYPEYKGHRPSMPDDLALQIEPIHEAVKAMGWHVLTVSGVEADDIIGTLAHRATEKGVRTVVSTGDKDLAQLVNEHVELVNTMNGGKQDVQGVIDKFGVRPDQIVEYLMLTGDAVDNIPGVEKVGPKTAAKWLNQYGSIEEIVKHADEIKGVAGQNLRDAIPNFDMTRQLLTVKVDCDIPFLADDFSDLVPKQPDREKLVQLYDEFGFRTWLRELTGDDERVPSQDSRVAADPPAAPDSVEYDTILDWKGFDTWLERIESAPLVALDTETTSLDPMAARLVGMSMSTAAGTACYIPLRHCGPDQVHQLPFDEVMDRLRPWLENKKAPKLLHNAKYDAHVFMNEGIQLAGIVHDSMLQAYVLESHRRVNMQELAERWLGRKGISYEDLCGKGAKQIGFEQVEVEKAAFYGAEDADFTWQLHEVLSPKIKASSELERIYALEVEASAVLTIIERNGVLIDAKLLGEQSGEIGRKMAEFEAKAHELAGQPFNLNSPKQLGEILFNTMKLPVVRKTAGGAPSTDEEVLTRLAHDYPLPQVILEYRGLAKLKSTYTDKLPKMINPDTGRVHTRYSQAAVITGRLASSDPNLQNIPVRTPEGRRVRAAFISRSGKIVSADYSQIELRVMAHVSGDKSLQKAFADGLDIHRATAAEIFGVALDEVTSEQRRSAKAINFGLIYGMGEFGLANALGITRDAARSYIDRYFARYPGVAQYMEDTKARAHEQGYVETVFGRRLWLPDIKGSKGPRRAGAERAAINAPMQGTAADLIKMAMVAVQKWIYEQKLETLMVMQVHDELVFEVPEKEVEMVTKSLPDLMCNVAKLDVPLVAEVGVGPNWEQAH